MTQSEAAQAIHDIGVSMRTLAGGSNHLRLEWGYIVPGAPGSITCTGPGSFSMKQTMGIKAKSVRTILYGFVDEFPTLVPNVKVLWGPDVQDAQPATPPDPLPPTCTICQGREYYV